MYKCTLEKLIASASISGNIFIFHLLSTVAQFFISPHAENSLWKFSSTLLSFLFHLPRIWLTSHFSLFIKTLMPACWVREGEREMRKNSRLFTLQKIRRAAHESVYPCYGFRIFSVLELNKIKCTTLSERRALKCFKERGEAAPRFNSSTIMSLWASMRWKGKKWRRRRKEHQQQLSHWGESDDEFDEIGFLCALFAASFCYYRSKREK